MRFIDLSLGAVLSLVALTGCSSSSDGPATATDSGSSNDTAAPIDTATTRDDAVADTSTPTDTAVAVDTAPADTAPATDVADSAECKQFCDALKAACPSATCAPRTDCAIKSGYCAAAEKDYLKCKAETGTFTCGSSGWGVSSSCRRDVSLC